MDLHPYVRLYYFLTLNVVAVNYGKNHRHLATNGKELEMKLVDVTDRAGLDALYKDSALTFEGITRDSIPDVVNWVKRYTRFKNEEEVFVVSGKTMNDFYGLTGINQYVTHLNIVCIKLANLVEPMKLALPRFRVGGRWFDDVVDNNARRENRGEEE